MTSNDNAPSLQDIVASLNNADTRIQLLSAFDRAHLYYCILNCTNSLNLRQFILSINELLLKTVNLLSPLLLTPALYLRALQRDCPQFSPSFPQSVYYEDSFPHPRIPSFDPSSEPEWLEPFQSLALEFHEFAIYKFDPSQTVFVLYSQLENDSRHSIHILRDDEIHEIFNALLFTLNMNDHSIPPFDDMDYNPISLYSDSFTRLLTNDARKFSTPLVTMLPELRLHQTPERYKPCPRTIAWTSRLLKHFKFPHSGTPQQREIIRLLLDQTTCTWKPLLWTFPSISSSSHSRNYIFFEVINFIHLPQIEPSHPLQVHSNPNTPLYHSRIELDNLYVRINQLPPEIKFYIWKLALADLPLPCNSMTGNPLVNPIPGTLFPLGLNLWPKPTEVEQIKSYYLVHTPPDGPRPLSQLPGTSQIYPHPVNSSEINLFHPAHLSNDAFRRTLPTGPPRPLQLRENPREFLNSLVGYPSPQGHAH
jgi:hypothetical protein